jgi:ectoine hydroxylase-related dioxygenase (phytanoyl-CoA dioxygenase family)
MSTTTTVTITEQQKKQYRDEGYFILERVIPEDHLEMLREECQNFINKIDAEMDAKGVTTNGINHKASRYFISCRYKESDRLHEFIYSELMAEICRATIGDEAYLFWEQYVVKAAEKGMKFSWHQDSGYVGFPHKPYVTCWCALDDMSEANGTAYILPYSRAKTKEVVEHVREEGSNDLIGYKGSDPGDPVLVPAGSIAVFSSTTLHRSGFNTTNKMRRVYLPQYASEKLFHPKTGEAKGCNDAFLKNGKIVYKR